VDAAEIARRFALGAGATLSDGPVARGRMGHVWRLETADGSWAVKVPLESPIEDEVRVAASFQEAAYAAGVPTPQVKRTVDGSVFATLGGSPVRVYGWVDLRPPDLRLDPVLVGTALAAMHRVADAADGSVEAWYAAPVGAARWDGLIERLRTAEAPFAERLAALRDELVALESWIEPADVLRICHRDLWADNVLPTAAGGICVIDWENTGPADPSQELACVLFEFARDDSDRARALMAAYRDAGGPARVDRRGHFSMLIAQLGHIAEIAGRDWLEPNPRSPTRDGAAAWIGEVLDDPHTPDRLDALLAAVRDG
jgi:Ser/Thr protein kinase RdoA (MazF antagonist)